MSKLFVGMMCGILFASAPAPPLLGQEPEEDVEGAPVLPAVEVEAAQLERVKSTSILTEETMQGEYSMNMNDYFLAGIPGVSTARRSNFGFSGPNAGFFIRGLNGPRVAVFVDGVPSQVNNHFHPRTDQYSPDMIQRIEVIRGPSSVLHGPSAVGGVVEITTRKPEPGLSGYGEAHAGELDTRLLEGEIAYGWETGYALFSGMDRETDAQILDEGFDLTNLNFKIRQDVGGDWGLGFRFNNTEEDPSDRFGDDSEQVFFRFTEDLSTYVVTADRQTASSNSLIAFSFNELDTGSFRESINQGPFMESNRIEQETGLYGRHGWRWGATAITAGAEIVQYSDETPGQLELDESYFSAFGHGAGNLTDRIELSGGLRLTTSGQFGTDASPEVGLIGRIDPTLALRLRGGKAFRVPRIGEVNAAIVNEDLEPEDFYHAEVGINKRIAERIVFDAALWYMRGDNLIARVGTGPDQTNVNTGEFRHRGFESSVSIHAHQYLSLLFGLGILDVNEEEDDELIRLVPEQTFDVGADVHVGNFRGTLIGRYAGDNSTFSLEDPEGNEELLEDYFVGDIRLQYDLGRGLPSLILDIVNFTDEEYATFVTGLGPIEQVPRTVLGGIRWGWGPGR